MSRYQCRCGGGNVYDEDVEEKESIMLPGVVIIMLLLLLLSIVADRLNPSPVRLGYCER